jgi:type II secretion system (T2SS) protein E
MTARKRLGEILVQAGVLSEPQLRAALNEQKRWGGPLGRILVDMKFITEEQMIQALSHQLNFPAVNLDQRLIDEQVLALVPGDFAESHSLVPFAVQGKFLDVAMSDPTNLAVIDELRIRTRMNVRPYLSGPKAIERAMARWYGRGMVAIDFGGGGGASSGISQSGPEVRITAPVSIPEHAMVLDPSQPYEQPLAITDVMVTRPPAPPAPPTPQPAKRDRTPIFGVPVNPAAPQTQPPGTLPPIGGNPAVNAQKLAALEQRVQRLEALLARDEDVLRKLLNLIVDKGLATREELMARIK